jgi:hypothetical protein
MVAVAADDHTVASASPDISRRGDDALQGVEAGFVQDQAFGGQAMPAPES